MNMGVLKRTKSANSIWNGIKNATIYRNKYRAHSEGVIVACYFNPQKSPYRTKAFNIFYESIKHLNHRIVECVIGEGEPEFHGKHISHVYTKDLLWHKESLLNKVISELPEEYKYVFWIDADVIFTNKNWFVEGVEALSWECKIIQPFEYCVHLEKDEIKPSFNYEIEKQFAGDPKFRHKSMWRSFCSNSYTTRMNTNYDRHGHVGFAWGARREILYKMPLYDKALIGGADHIIAHASSSHRCHECIQKSFTENIDDVNEWSYNFSRLILGSVGYVKGDLFHIWHGDIEKRQYLKRVQEFTPKTKEIVEKDENGLYVHNDTEAKEYMESYFSHREVGAKVPNKLTSRQKVLVRDKYNEYKKSYPTEDDSFINSLIIGYLTDSGALGYVFGGDILGAMIGDALNNSDDSFEFGGGESGGGGAGGSWEVNNHHASSENTSHNLVFTESNDKENFS
jgi:hypothetical protein